MQKQTCAEQSAKSAGNAGWHRVRTNSVRNGAYRMDYQPVIRHALWRTPDFECKKGKNQEFLLNLIVNMLNDTRFMEKNACASLPNQSLWGPWKVDII